MAAFRPSARWLKDTSGYSSRLLQRTIKQRLAAEGKTLERSSKLPVIPKCPEPTCECADMPPDLDIDQTKDLNGTIAAYSEQIIVSTGQADWKSKIEDEKDTTTWGSIVAQVKELLGPKGKFHDPYRNIIVSTSSFASPESGGTQALLFPSFQVVDGLESSESSIRDFVEAMIVSKNKSNLSEDEMTWRRSIRPISSPTILICSHNSRDSRCGILGPLLHTEFSQYINKELTLRNEAVADLIDSKKGYRDQIRSFASHPTYQADIIDSSRNNQQPVNIGMISHIGGHKWAGNVIVYIPPDYRLRTLERDAAGAKPKDKIVAGELEAPKVSQDQPLLPEEEQHDLSPLAGKGIWYGRVQPKHVEGIVEQTIGRGNIIKELFRGGINQDGSPIRM